MCGLGRGFAARAGSRGPRKVGLGGDGVMRRLVTDAGRWNVL